MPQIVDYAPAWLSRPSPGASFFSPSGADKAASPGRHARGLSDTSARNEAPYEGPLRILARRGNEVFVVVDNQIRWAKLTSLKDEWHREVRKKRDGSRGQEAESDKGEVIAGGEDADGKGSGQYKVF